MPSLNLDLDFFDHRKTKRLVFLLGEGSELCVIRLWVYCGRFHPEDGRFGDESESEIESIAGWRGDAGKMLQAMLAACYMHKDKHGYFMHDWRDHQGHICRYSLQGKKMAEARWAKCAVGNAASNATGNARANRADRAEPTESPPTPQGGDGAGLFPDLPPTAPPPEPNGLHPEQLRLNALFRHTTRRRWSLDEVKLWRSLSPIPEQEFRDVERYFAGTHPTGKDYRPRSLGRLLKTWNAVVDRAENYSPPSCL